jgi:hypothetical protein
MITETWGRAPLRKRLRREAITWCQHDGAQHSDRARSAQPVCPHQRTRRRTLSQLFRTRLSYAAIVGPQVLHNLSSPGVAHCLRCAGVVCSQGPIFNVFSIRRPAEARAWRQSTSFSGGTYRASIVWSCVVWQAYLVPPGIIAISAIHHDNAAFLEAQCVKLERPFLFRIVRPI